MITRIDADTIKITTEEIIKISDLEAKKSELEAIDTSAKEYNSWIETLPEEKRGLIPEMPETEIEILSLQSKIEEYKSLPVEKTTDGVLIR